MISCNTCRRTLVTGSLYCTECGAPLINIVENQSQSPDPDPPKEFQVNTMSDQPLPKSVVSLHIVDVGQIISLTGRQEFTLGRISGSQSVLPDIDLAPYEAYEKGTSRLHASIKLDGQFVSIIDLGSVNGTYLNGKPIPVHEPQTLSNGDNISLGDLKVQILIPW
jgi:pSer/pThr/pTyr-binding forkhead associated (FHA) protein